MKLGFINTTLKRNHDNRAIPTADKQVEKNTLGGEKTGIDALDDAIRVNDIEQVQAQNAPHRDDSNDIRKPPNIANII